MAYTATYSIVDAKGARSTTSVNFRDEDDYERVVDAAGDMAVLINDLISGQIVGISLTRTVDVPGAVRSAPVTNSDVEEGARFQFRTTNGFDTSLRLPTFLESKIATNSKAVNLTDTQVAAFITAMTEGIVTNVGGTNVTLDPTDSRGEDIVSLSFAREQFVSSRAGRGN